MVYRVRYLTNSRLMVLDIFTAPSQGPTLSITYLNTAGFNLLPLQVMSFDNPNLNIHQPQSADVKSIDILKLVFYSDILLISIFIILSFVHVPSGSGRVQAWWHTLFLCNGTPVSANSMQSSVDFSMTKSMEDSDFVSAVDTIGTVFSPPIKRKISSTFRSIDLRLQRCIFPGCSIWKALAMGIYSAILTSLIFYRSNIFTNPSRTGIIAVSQLPLAFLSATRNNILNIVIGYIHVKVCEFESYLLITQASSSTDQFFPSIPWQKYCSSGQYPYPRIR